jgi:hypothetical protein
MSNKDINSRIENVIRSAMRTRIVEVELQGHHYETESFIRYQVPPKMINFKSIATKDGLSNPSAHSIVQHHTGFLEFSISQQMKVT